MSGKVWLTFFIVNYLHEVPQLEQKDKALDMDSHLSEEPLASFWVDICNLDAPSCALLCKIE